MLLHAKLPKAHGLTPETKLKVIAELRERMSRAARRADRASSDAQYAGEMSTVEALARQLAAIAATPVGRVPSTEA